MKEVNTNSTVTIYFCPLILIISNLPLNHFFKTMAQSNALESSPKHGGREGGPLILGGGGFTLSWDLVSEKLVLKVVYFSREESATPG